MSDHKEGGCQDAVSSGPAGTGQPGASAGAPSQAGEGNGAMNAHDIPRYNSEGYVLGRPDMPNDPTSAGTVQGAQSGNAAQSMDGGYGGPTHFSNGQPESGTMGYGTMDGANGQAMYSYGPMGQPGMQAPPQGMGYAGMDAAQGQPMAGCGPVGQPGMQPPPQGVGYAGMETAYGQPMNGFGPVGQPGMQPPPQGMTYPGVNTAGGATMAQQPGFQPPPGMVPNGGGAAYTAPGYYQQPYPGDAQAYAAAGQTAPGNYAENYGRIAEVVKDLANGEQPDVNKLAALYSGFDAQFWKGALIGAVLTVLLTSETVRGAVAGTLGGIMGAFKQSEPPAADVGADADATGA